MDGITVKIVAGTDKSTSSVQASGQVQHVITDEERKQFGIQDAQLKTAVERYFGKEPNDAYVHSPTPWGDLYKTYGWPQVETVLRVKGAEITEITSEPVILSTKTFTNKSRKTGLFNCSISDQVTDTVESNWSQTHSLQVTQTFKYEVGFLGTGGGGETSMSYTGTFGQGGSHSTSVTVGSAEGVSVELQPGESIVAQLTSSRGKMKVRITYEAFLKGDTAVNYNPKYKDHHFWGLNIANVMQAGGIKNSILVTEEIEIGYFSGGTLDLMDPQGQMKLRMALAA